MSLNASVYSSCSQQHFSLIERLINAILSILNNVRVFVLINIFLCNSAILIKSLCRDDASLWF